MASTLGGISSAAGERMPTARIEENRRSLLIVQAAAVLGVSRRTVYNRIRAGELETIRTLGGSQRVLLASVQRALERQVLLR